MAAPADTLYVTADSGSELVLIKPTSVAYHSTVFGGEGPLAVYGSVVTTGIQPGDYGASYNLSGTFSGGVNTSPFTNPAMDGTTDGTHNYVIDSVGDVYSTKLTYQLPTFLFSAGSDATGISYDPVNGSLWIDDNGLVEDYSKTGALIRAFATGFTGYSALAFDRNDATLWMGSDLAGGVILTQYTAAGKILQTDSITLSDIDGMEFDEHAAASTPEPSPVLSLAFGAGIFALSGRRSRIKHSLKSIRRSAGRSR